MRAFCPEAFWSRSLESDATVRADHALTTTTTFSFGAFCTEDILTRHPPAAAAADTVSHLTWRQVSDGRRAAAIDRLQRTV